MPSPSEPQLLTGNYAPVPDETTVAGLTVEGTLPTGLCGQYVRIGPNPLATTATPCDWDSLEGMVHGVALRAGRAVAYRNRWVTTDAVARTLGTDTVPGPPPTSVDTVATNVITFGQRTLALGPGALAYELDENLVTVGRVDLAGASRGIGARPQVDPLTGALHLVSYGDEPAHHIVSAGGQTRVTRPITAPPGPLTDLLLTRDRFVLLGDGFVGITDRAGEAQPRWIAVELTDPVAAHDDGHAVTVLTVGTSLARWAFDPAGRTQQHVLDDIPQQFGRINPSVVAAPARYLWTVAAAGGTEIYRHDLRTGDRTAHDLGAGHHPGEFTFVVDPSRRHREDGGWLIGLVHDEHRNEADLVVLDAAAIDRPPVASVRIPRRIPYGLHGTWIPAT